MSEPDIQEYRFGPYRIDTAERLLHRDDELISLPPKAIDTLLVLVGGAGRMVDKSDLMKAVWPDTFVEEGALTRNISVLRKALGDTKDDGGYIETIPRRGYRFVAAIQTGNAVPPAATRASETGQARAAIPEPAANETVSAAPLLAPRIASRITNWTAPASFLLLAAIMAMVAYVVRGHEATPDPPAKAPPANTLAVLPFRNVNDDSEQQYFADGMTQAMITVLAKLGNLRVISLASEEGGPDPAGLEAALRNPSITRLLIGTVQRSGGRVRISAQLRDPKTGLVVWSEEYTRDLEDVLALQSEVAQAIANEIQVTITPEDKQRLQHNPVIKPEAQDAYYLGQNYWNPRTEDGMVKAKEYFQRAVDLDPTYALAHSGLADSYSMLGSVGIDGMWPKDAMEKAKSEAKEALRIDNDLAAAHASLAYVMLSYDWDLAGARKEFERALALDPDSATAHHWYSHYFMAAGDIVNATKQMQAAQQSEPLSPSIKIGIGWCYYYGHRYQEAIEQYLAVIKTDPSLPMAHQALGMAYQQKKGMMPQALDQFNLAVFYSNSSPGSVGGLATAYADAGQLVQAHQELKQLEEISKHRYVPALYFASAYLALGDKKQTLHWGWEALKEKSDYLLYLRMEPQASKLKADPEFLQILHSLQP